VVKQPENSRIAVSGSSRDPVISIPYAKPPAAFLPAGAFLVFWLGGWAFGEISVVRQIARTPADASTAFLVFWLCAWTVAGGMAMLMVRRVFQRSVPETLSLDAGGLLYDSGTPPFRMSYGARSTPSWSSLFPKRTQRKIDRSHLNSLRLRDGDTRNRLTVDVGAERVELARDATDVEREWLFKMIADRYALVAEQ
jgi:hypothetical protein